MTLSAAVALAAGLSVVGRLIRWLTTGGMIAAAAVGTAVFAGASLPGAALLALFFVSASALTAVTAGSQTQPTSQRLPSTGRTAQQVMANGVWPAVGAVLAGVGSPVGWPLLVGSLAAAQADTWATEIGFHSKTAPRLITSGRRVDVGTSGGVTLLGTAGGLAGAAVMAALGWAMGSDIVGVAACVGGTVGMFADSLLGATVQAVYYCESCSKETEVPLHRCGRSARLLRGRRWMNNDAVNLAGSAIGGLLTTTIWASL